MEPKRPEDNEEEEEESFGPKRSEVMEEDEPTCLVFSMLSLLLQLYQPTNKTTLIESFNGQTTTTDQEKETKRKEKKRERDKI